jgi:hypothetical protein
MRCHGLPNKRCQSCGSLLHVGVVWEEMVSALWFGSQAKRDTAAMICGVTLAAVVPRQSLDSRQASPRQTTYAEYLRKSGMRHETTVVRRRGEACIRLQAQDGDEKNWRRSKK